ncbi:hypothetical protein LIS82_22380 [Cytobacillus solani]|uniref:hypothetical protein n=1 Tax=Cytobacillus solani TaxID=1637975 RepID=UPI0006ABB04E|nr:hypothetical protein [Cytobacillus solani]KOP84087.1 hypothetical protein AMS60_00060 [Bacillus sp. FJAT-21945]USK54272.1 hypothetical protein LIS82_22380 [Cytobacillus solani]
MKKHIAILLILLLAISTQAFASSHNYILINDEKVEVTEKAKVTDANEVSMETELQLANHDSREKLEPERLEELSISLDDDDSSIVDKLCWVCTKYVHSEDPKFYVCVDGYWSKYCRIQ